MADLDSYADGIKYALGANNNVSGLLTVISEVTAQNKSLRQQAETLNTTILVLNKIRDRVDALCNPPGEKDEAFDHIDNFNVNVQSIKKAIALPKFKTPCSPKELAQQIEAWLQEDK